MASPVRIPAAEQFEPGKHCFSPDGATAFDEWPDDPHWRLLARVLQSKGFSKSQRSTDFLLYVCQKALNGNASDLNEQDIGVNVFTRRDGFDAGLDNIVRVTARRVRQRLDEYFAGEGCAEPMVLSIPVGGYIPRFDRRERVSTETCAEFEALGAPAIDTSQLPVTARPFLTWQWLAVISILLICATAVFAWQWRKREVQEGSPTHRMWSALLDSNRRSIFVPGDSALVLLENRMHRPVSLADYMNKSYLDHISATTPYPMNIEREEAVRPYTSIVDVRFAARIARLPEAGSPVDVVLARDLRMEDLKESNVILSGAREADPWVQMFQDQLNYSIVDRQEGDNYIVLNHHPINGEPSTYTYKSDDPAHTAYAFVAYLPNLSGQGRVLLLQGTTMAGTEAAMDFVLEPKGLDRFLTQHTHSRQVPPFEALLKTTNINGSSPKSEILSFRFH